MMNHLSEMLKYKKKWNDFQGLKVETYLERTKADNKVSLAKLKKKLKKMEKSEKNT